MVFLSTESIRFDFILRPALTVTRLVPLLGSISIHTVSPTKVNLTFTLITYCCYFPITQTTCCRPTLYSCLTTSYALLRPLNVENGHPQGAQFQNSTGRDQ